jgi:hypothetical protein
MYRFCRVALAGKSKRAARSRFAPVTTSAALVVILSVATASPGFAQTAVAPPALNKLVDPLDADAKVPQATYSSAFEGYQQFRDIDVGPWRAMNDRVGEIGGWRIYAREIAQGAAESAPAVSLPPTAPAASSPPAAPKGAPVHKH